VSELPNGIPDGCKHLYGSLFMVPFDCIRTPDSDEGADDYKFKNPRILTETGQSDLLDKQASKELRESIKNHTLLSPIVCRWVKDKNGYYPSVIAGDRRYRSVDWLIRKKEMVADPNSAKIDEKGHWVYSHAPANKVYASIACQIFSCNDDLEALALAWAENKTRINLTEGHEIAETIKLRKHGATDERIQKILQRDAKWLAETDSLIKNLDSVTLSELIENRIDRDSAIQLCKIENVETRSRVREAANAASNEVSRRKIERIQKQVENALEKQEIAEGAVVNAEFHNDEEAVAEAKTELRAAEKKVKEKIKARDETKPVTTAKYVKKAISKVSGDVRDDRPAKILSPKKIKEGIDYLDSLIAAEGKCFAGSFVASIEQLNFTKKILEKNIMANDSDFAETIRCHLNPDNEADEADDEDYEVEYEG